MRLIALTPIKHGDGIAMPGKAFEGDESLIEAGLAEAAPEPIEPVKASKKAITLSAEA